VITLLALEAWLRIFPDREIQVNNPYRFTQMKGVKALGHPFWHYQEIYPLRPPEFDPRAYYAATKGVVDYFFDQHGARWTSNTARALGKNYGIVLGDSYAYGFGIRYEDSFVALAEKALHLPLANLDQPSADVEGALRKQLHGTGARLKPKLILYGLHLNDVFRFPSDYLITNPLLTDSALLRHSRLAEFAVKKWDALIERRRRIRELLNPASYEAYTFTANFAALEKMNAEARARRAAFRVIILPLFVDVRQDTFRPLYNGVRERLERAGIAIIDLSDGWRQFADSDLWITPYDQHPNELANRLFAERLAQELRKLPEENE
jgi:hypothetical protein